MFTMSERIPGDILKRRIGITKSCVAKGEEESQEVFSTEVKVFLRGTVSMTCMSMTKIERQRC